MRAIIAKVRGNVQGNPKNGGEEGVKIVPQQKEKALGDLRRKKKKEKG